MSRSASYLTAERLERLDGELTEQDRQLIGLLAVAHLASGGQLKRVCRAGRSIGDTASHDRQTRRRLARLVEFGVLSRLARRIGGVRAGSSGFVYTLAPAGQRLSARWRGGAAARGRRPHEPGARFVDHRLAVTELYVALLEAHEGGGVDLLDFQAEPDSWRPFAGAWGRVELLKPDAFARLTTTSGELLWFIEVDRGTVSSATIRRQLSSYLAYWRGGYRDDDVMPRVLWLVPHRRRAAAVQSLIAASGAPDGLLVVGLLDDAISWLTEARPDRGGQP
jgi:Replication-relaxation